MASVDLYDTRDLGRLPTWNGEEQTWPEFEMKAESWMLMVPLQQAPLDMEQLINDAVRWPTEISMTGVDPDVVKASRTIFYALLYALTGKAAKFIRQVPRENGFELWRVVEKKYETAQGGRLNAVLIGLLSPAWVTESVTTPFLELLYDWGNSIATYENQATDVV